MNTNKLGCLSPLAIAGALLAVFALIIAEIINGNAMFSPGTLHAAHANIGDNCGQCHAPFWSAQTMTNLCTDCHQEIQRELGDSATLHGTLVRGADTTCQSCHTEHAGPSANLTVMDTSSFPHETTGFALTGHAFHSEGVGFTCSDCHTESISRFDERTCTECHRSLDATYTEKHLATFGEDCLACHDGVDRYGDFTHSQTGFDLSGAHLRVECSACHAGAHTIAQLQETSTACVSCHLSDDAHNGKFGAQCGECHNLEAWKPATFDHSQSDFPLEGKHVELECERCHTQGYAGTPVECAACHADPAYHLGMFPGQPCSQCHTTAGWQPARYESPHSFPLNHGQESNRLNTCADCHQPTLAQWMCYTCHDRAEIENEHSKEGIANFNDCLRCHPTGQKDEADSENNDND